MGHAVNYYSYPEKTKEKDMFADAVDYAFYNVDRGENPDGSYHGNWRIYSGICDNYEAAVDFLESKGVYCDGAVKFYDHDRVNYSATSYRASCFIDRSVVASVLHNLHKRIGSAGPRPTMMKVYANKRSPSFFIFIAAF